MQVNISKKHGRQVKLNKRERDLLLDSRQLLGEIATVTIQETAEAAMEAADGIASVVSKLDKLPLVAAEAHL